MSIHGPNPQNRSIQFIHHRMHPPPPPPPPEEDIRPHTLHPTHAWFGLVWFGLLGLNASAHAWNNIRPTTNLTV